MTEQTGGVTSLDMVIGEVRGQLTRMIANVDKLSEKQDKILDALAIHAGVPADLANFKVDTASKLAAMDVRLKVVETAEVKRDGAIGMAQAVLNSRAFGWIVGGATTIYFLVSGKLHL